MNIDHDPHTPSQSIKWIHKKTHKIDHNNRSKTVIILPLPMKHKMYKYNTKKIKGNQT